MEFSISTNLTLKDIFINVFKDSIPENIIEKKNAAVQALFNLVKEYGMILW